MSEPTPINLFGVVGATLVTDLTFTRKNSAGAVVPVDLTGATIWMTGKVKYADPDPGFFQVTSAGANADGGIVITDYLGGTATATVFDTVTAGYTGPLRLVYDVKVAELSGEESVPIFGQITFRPAATRAL